jgi:aldose 1-epimerase
MLDVPTQLVLASEELEVVVLPDVGARLHRIRAWGEDLLRTPSDPATHAADPWFWGGYVLAPWGNRVRPGPTEVLGRLVDVPANFPDGSAIHGQVSHRPWDVVGDGQFSVEGGGEGTGWPWRYVVTAWFGVDGSTLSLRYELRNLDDGPMPAGLGLHPWFLGPLELRVPAASVYPSNTESPVRAEPVAGPLDLRTSRPPAAALDATWVDLEEPAIDLVWARSGMAARFTVARPSPDTVAVPVATPEFGAVAVEPQTHGPDGLRRLLHGEPHALAVLHPGHSLELAMTLSVRRTG